MPHNKEIEEIVKDVIYNKDIDWEWDIPGDTVTYHKIYQLHGKIKETLTSYGKSQYDKGVEEGRQENLTIDIDGGSEGMSGLKVRLYTNEEMKKRFEKEFNSLYGINVSVLNSEPVMIGNPPIADLLSFINQEISDLKKSIREEIESKKLKNLLEARDNGFNEEEEMFAFNQALDEILSLKSLE